MFLGQWDTLLPIVTNAFPLKCFKISKVSEIEHKKYKKNTVKYKYSIWCEIWFKNQ